MNKNIFFKMLVIFSIPAIGMLAYSAIYTYSKYQSLKSINNISFSINYVQKAELLLNNIQKERGLSAAYIGSKNKHFLKQLINQKKQSDLSIQEYKKFIVNKKFESLNNKKIIKKIQKEIFNLNKLREEVLALNIELKEELKEYNKLTNSIITSMRDFLSDEEKNIFNKKLHSIINIIQAQEYAGLERAMLSNIFSKKAIDNLEEYNEVIKLIALQKKQSK